MKYLLIGVVVAILILGFLASKNNDKRDELAAAKAQQLAQLMPKQAVSNQAFSNEVLPSKSTTQPAHNVGATSYVQSLQRAEQSAKDVGKTQDEYMQKMQQAEQQ